LEAKKKTIEMIHRLSCMKPKIRKNIDQEIHRIEIQMQKKLKKKEKVKGKKITSICCTNRE
jgi:hypothetical protein